MSSAKQREKDQRRAFNAAHPNSFFETNPECKKIYDLIYQKNTSATSCAQPFIDRTVRLAASPGSECQISDFVDDVTGAILEVGARTPYSDLDIQSKLVDFVHELQKVVIMDPNSTTGEPLSYMGEQRSVIWTDLPMFWFWCTEVISGFEVEDPTNTLREISRWKNLSAFWAGLSRSKTTDFVRHGLGAFLDAFGPHDSPNEARPSLLIQHIACIWFIYAADTIWLCCQEGTENRNRESWEHWKKGIEGLQDQENDVETQDLVNRALVAVNRAEQIV